MKRITLMGLSSTPAMKIIYGLLIMFFALIISNLMVGCDNNFGQSKKPEPKQMPVLVGIIYDKSGSVKHEGVINSLNLARLARATAYQNGAIAIGTIREYSFVPLTVAEFGLSLLPVEGNLRQKNQAIAENKRREAKIKERIEIFVREAMQRLDGPRDAQKSDIAGAIERFFVLMNQPQYQNWRKILILHTDGLDNQTKSYNYVPDAEFYTIGWRAADAEAKLKNSITQFEGFSACVDFLAKQLKED